MKTAGQILDEKHKDPTTIEPHRPVLDALRLMAEDEVGAVMVVDRGALVGVLSERDYVRRVVLPGLAPDVTVSAVMTVDVVTAAPGYGAEECMALMMQRHVRHLPVLDGDTLVGVISVRDVVKATLDEKEFRIDQLETYISGRHRL